MRLLINRDVLLLGLFMAPNNLNSSYIMADIGNMSGIETVNKYVKEDEKIKELFELYTELIKKDVGDIRGMVGLYEKTDRAIGGNFGGGGGGSRF